MYVCLKVAETEYHRLDGLNNKHLFLTALEAKSQGVSTAGFWEVPSSKFIKNHLLVVFSHSGEKGHLLCLLYKGTSPTHGVSSLKVSSLPEGFPPNTIILEARISTRELRRGNTKIQYLVFSCTRKMSQKISIKLLKGIIFTEWDETWFGGENIHRPLLQCLDLFFNQCIVMYNVQCNTLFYDTLM